MESIYYTAYNLHIPICPSIWQKNKITAIKEINSLKKKLKDMENPEFYMKTSTYSRVWETKISNFNMIIKKKT